MSRIARVLFFCIALIVAATISYTVYKRMTGPVAPVADGGGESATVSIAVAATDLARGDLIEAADLRMAAYLEKTLPPGHFTASESLVGRVVLTPVAASQPILESSLAPKDIAKGGMAAFINQQKRAMAVKVDNVIGVAGFLQPGHLVDVLVSVDAPDDSGGPRVTKTVLENIPVLAIGTLAEETAEKKARQVTVVTLEVSLEEGEKLSLAVHQGNIHLALRNYTDFDEVLTRGATVEQLLASYSPDDPLSAMELPADLPPAPRPQAPSRNVQVINGDKAQDVNLSK